jgi:hypothetical protein
MDENGDEVVVTDLAVRYARELIERQNRRRYARKTPKRKTLDDWNPGRRPKEEE